MEESPSSSRSRTRLLKDTEKALLRQLFQKWEGSGSVMDRLDSLEVTEMSDGGM